MSEGRLPGTSARAPVPSLVPSLLLAAGPNSTPPPGHRDPARDICCSSLLQPGSQPHSQV